MTSAANILTTVVIIAASIGLATPSFSAGNRITHGPILGRPGSRSMGVWSSPVEQGRLKERQDKPQKREREKP